MPEDLIQKLQAIKERWMHVGELLGDPQIIADRKRFVRLNREYKDLSAVVEAHTAYANVLANMDDSKHILHNTREEELREMAKSELHFLSLQKESLEEKIRTLLLPRDEDDEKNAILEIRAGTGGDEAALFAADLWEMYTRYCAARNWKAEIMNKSESERGGYKEIIAEVTGEGVYGRLKYESGVHRVQRVPETESQGRVHTSAATVAVLPEAEEFDLDINPADIKVDVFRASGAGGQHVNRTESAVRMTHIPTGIVVENQDERSQIKNREKAMKVLRARVYEKFHSEHMAGIAEKRKTLVSTGDRSAKIRTYNFPQNRITDHRIHLTLYNLSEVMNGALDVLIDNLQIAENAEKMRSGKFSEPENE